MAEQVVVSCKIIKITPNPKGGDDVYVECSIGKRTWVKPIYCIYDRPISFEEFKRDLSSKIWLKDELDNLRFVKEESDKPFEIKVARKNEV